MNTCLLFTDNDDVAIVGMGHQNVDTFTSLRTMLRLGGMVLVDVAGIVSYTSSVCI